MAFGLGIPRCNDPPAIFQETIDATFKATLQPVDRAIVDNGDESLGTVPGVAGGPGTFRVARWARNIGCAGAWNYLCHTTFQRPGCDSAILLNSDCAVAEDTFARMLASPAGVVLAHGFACFRLDRRVWERIGPFDEEFYPAYFEDTDYRRRLALAGEPVEEWPVDIVREVLPGRVTTVQGITHGKPEGIGYQGWTGEKAAWFRERLLANQARFAAKWGGKPGEETFTTPFGGLAAPPPTLRSAGGP